jgi:galactokinase/mevalonate kinase-like predicted kinase
MNLLGVQDGSAIAYGGCFAMEIYKDENKYYVEVLSVFDDSFHSF